LILPAFLILSLVFAALYLVARRIDNYGIVDIAWAFSFGAAALFYALTARGWPVRRATVAGLAVLWSLRLGGHLYRRVMGHHPIEDGRYQQLRRDWAGSFAWKMFGFFQLQAVSVLGLSLPFLFAAQNPAPHWHLLESAGVLLWLLAISGEALADRQLNRFKLDPANRGRVCASGLWRYSRHPNYFFEWLVWVAWFVFASASPWGWVSIICPVSILYLLLKVTGIPLTEEQSLRSKGDAYRRYQQTTSAFVPWWPKQ
jgi:steroid 5-alpha reductase family enzyme